MALTFTRFSWWPARGKDAEPVVPANPSLSSSSDLGLGFREPDTLRFPSMKESRMRSSSRKVKRKWQSREERKIDREYDIVIVPSDGCCMSGSESEDSDWSIGWLEPHSADFNCDSESEGSFAVLVPCYGLRRCERAESPERQFLGGVDFPNVYSSDSKKYIEQWLSSLQNY